MTSTFVRAEPVARLFGAVGRPRRPSGRHLIAAAVATLLVALASTTISTIAYLQLPSPTGPAAVGRADTLLTDPARIDAHNGHPRSVRIIAWYPAVAGAGAAASYVPGYDALRSGLEASGELHPAVVAVLGFVRTTAREGVAPVAGAGGLPVILLEPGNATNVAFYSSLAEELASRGYAVIGIDHPYQVAAVALAGGQVAVYPGDGSAGAFDGAVAAKVDERLADIAFVLEELVRNGAGIPALEGHLDLTRVGIVGHSNGGIAAAQACEQIARVLACMNIDGQSAGGPFSATTRPTAPGKPFLYLTKETQLHPTLAGLFEAGGGDTYRVIVPAATHEAFTDGPRFQPRLAPLDNTADAVLAVERGFTLAFFDHVLRAAPQAVFGQVNAPTDVQVSVYPLGSNGASGRPSP